MAIPRAAKAYDVMVQTWYQRLEDIRACADIGVTMSPTCNDWIEPLLASIARFDATVVDLQAAGLGPSELGPTVERLFGIADFMALLAEYVQIRDVKLPAVRAWLLAHPTGTWSLVDGRVVLDPYGETERAEVTGALNALLAHWA